MKKKALLAYAVLLLILLLSQVFHRHYSIYWIPFYLVVVPPVLGGRIKFTPRWRLFVIGLGASVAVLLPFYVIFRGRPFTALPSVGWLLYEFLAVAFAEEVFFRGFLQVALGNDFRGIILASLLFSLAHVPVALSSGDFTPLLTFFPSLVMGFLYMKTSDLLPGTLFHFFANVLFAGFMI